MRSVSRFVNKSLRRQHTHTEQSTDTQIATTTTMFLFDFCVVVDRALSLMPKERENIISFSDFLSGFHTKGNIDMSILCNVSISSQRALQNKGRKKIISITLKSLAAPW